MVVAYFFGTRIIRVPINQSINQSKHISIAPFVASESEAHKNEFATAWNPPYWCRGIQSDNCLGCVWMCDTERTPHHV